VSELIRLCEHAQSRLSLLRDVPYLVQHGVKDMVCLSSGTHQLMLGTDGVCGAARSLRALSGSWHDLLHEAEGQQVLDDMAECESNIANIVSHGWRACESARRASLSL
jgi:hypothetical protein